MSEQGPLTDEQLEDGPISETWVDALREQLDEARDTVRRLRAELAAAHTALKPYRDPDNWIHIPDDRGDMYWAWDDDGEPWQIAMKALAQAGEEGE